MAVNEYSSEELQGLPQLELARRRKVLSDEHHAKLKADLEEFSRMLSGLINGLDNRET